MRFFARRIGTHLLVKQTPASTLLAALDVAFASRVGVSPDNTATLSSDLQQAKHAFSAVKIPQY